MAFLVLVFLSLERGVESGIVLIMNNNNNGVLECSFFFLLLFLSSERGVEGGSVLIMNNNNNNNGVLERPFLGVLVIGKGR